MRSFRGVQGFEYRYTEVKRVGFLSKPVKSEGTLIYQSPNILEKRVSKPNQDQYRIVGEKLEIKKQGKKPRLVILGNYPELSALADSMRATFSGDATKLKKYYRLELQGTELNWKLTLYPTDTDLQEKIELIEIQGRKHKISRVFIKEMDGDESILSITTQSKSTAKSNL